MSGTYRTVVNTHKFSRFTAIAIGALLSIPLIFFGVITAQNAFTRASDAEPRDVIVQESVQNEERVVTVSWTTGQETLGVLKYGSSPTDLRFFAPEKSTEKTTAHQAELTLLAPGSKYYFKILIDDKEYDNGSIPWDFTTKGTGTDLPIEATPSSSGSADLTINPLPSSSPTVRPNVSGTRTPTPGLSITSIATGTPTTKPLATPTLAMGCVPTDCAGIRAMLGKGCTSVDYARCIALTPSTPITPTMTLTPSPTSTPTSTPTTTPTVTPTPTSIVMASGACAIDYVQPTSCTLWTWQSVNTKPQACRDVFSRYFLQCKNNSFVVTPSVTPPADIWYYNDVFTSIASNSATIPAANAPTPAPGSTVYCQLRAEDVIGGDSHSTQWVRSSKACP